MEEVMSGIFVWKYGLWASGCIGRQEALKSRIVLMATFLKYNVPGILYKLF